MLGSRSRGSPERKNEPSTSTTEVSATRCAVVGSAWPSAADTTDANGSADGTFFDITTLYTLSYLRYDWRTFLRTTYPRHKLADDGPRYPYGTAILTPERGKGAAIARYAIWVDAGYVEGLDRFRQDVLCERNTIDPTRMDWLLPVDLVNGAHVFATRIEFQL